jgi:hypothetical protein
MKFLIILLFVLAHANVIAKVNVTEDYIADNHNNSTGYFISYKKV